MVTCCSKAASLFHLCNVSYCAAFCHADQNRPDLITGTHINTVVFNYTFRLYYLKTFQDSPSNEICSAVCFNKIWSHSA